MKTIIGKCTPIFIATLTALTVFSCTKYQIPRNQITGPAPNTGPIDVSTCDPDTVYFQNSILPLLTSSCGMTGCHDEISHRHGITLTNYASIINTGNIKPGDPNNSEILESLTDNEDDMMPPPPFDPLSSDQIQMISKWIAQGASNNVCFDGCDTTVATFSGQIWPVLDANCTGCHNINNSRGGIIIADYTDAVSLAENGNLMEVIRWDAGYPAMPPTQQLSECSITLFQKWIDDGFPE